MKTNLFISYCHKDEEFKNELNVHLSSLKRRGVVSSWSDRLILPGSRWDQSIRDSMSNADIFILLISPDFVASDYCFDEEMRFALQRHQDGMALLVPVVVRHCDWGDLPISKIQALPLDAKPVSSWDDKDEAWLSVIEGIKSLVNDFNDSKVHQENIDFGKIEISKDVLEWLDDTDVQFSHRKVSKVGLKDIYVLPDFISLDSTAESSVVVGFEGLKERPGHYIVYGDEQIGKTSFLKRLFLEKYESGYLPVYLHGQDVKSGSIEKLVISSLAQQYQALSTDGVDFSRVVVLIDDFHSVKQNSKHIDIVLGYLCDNFAGVVITANEAYQYVSHEYEKMDLFVQYKMIGFGHKKRADLIRKWVSMGQEDVIPDKELYVKCDEAAFKLNAVIRKNIVPAKPIYLLGMLQMFEAYNPQNVELTSYGHCYQYLVYQSFDRANIRNSDVEAYLNVLTELAYAQYKNEGCGLDKFELSSFFDGYEKIYLPVNRQRVVEDLLNHGILINRSGKISFKYPYIYYFFAGKKFAESVSDKDFLGFHLDNMLENLHREDFGNIIVFITHHTKDKWVLERIEASLFELFSDHERASLLPDSVKFIGDFIGEIPALVLRHRSVDEARKSEVERLDAGEKERQAIEDEVQALDADSILARINKAFKGMELIGQIVRNRHASMRKDVLLKLVGEGFGTGLRFLSFFLSLSNVSKDEVIKYISHSLEDNPRISTKDVTREAERIYLHMTYGVISGVVQKMASSLGSKEAEPIYEEILKAAPTPAVQLVNQSIEFQFSKRLDVEKLRDLDAEFSGNPVCARILRELVVQHLYMFPVGYKEKQQVAETLKIAVEDQRILQMQKRLRK